MKTAFAAFALLSLTACAADGPAAAPPAAFDASATEFTGWVRVVGEEFRLYANETDLRTPSQRCVSGALPRDLQRASGDLSGQRVRFTGRTLAWSAHGEGPRYDWRGSKIENLCGRSFVILADGVTVTG